MGYRAPLPDRGAGAGQGPNRGLDLYLVDIGADSLGGYCLGDQDKSAKGDDPRSAYCVVDNDFSPRELSIPGRTARDMLRATVAHELFHAIQDAYEYSSKERWLDEGTAVWMEQQVVDPRQLQPPTFRFLEDSSLAQPDVPLNAFGANNDAEDNEYGAWIFWQFLTEWTGRPKIIRLVWEEVARNGRSETAVDAIDRALLRARAVPARCRVICEPGGFGEAFAEFEAWNARFAETYSDGPTFASQLRMAAPPPDGAFVVDSAAPNTGPQVISADHLSARRLIVASADATAFTIQVRAPGDGSTTVVLIQPYSGSTPQPAILAQPDVSGVSTVSLTNSTSADLILVNKSASGDPAPFTYLVRTP